MTPRGGGARAGLVVWALAAGLLAGLAAGLGGEAAYGAFRPPNRRPANFDQLDSYERGSVLSAIMRQEAPPTEAKNAALAYGMLGAALGAALGLAGGRARRPPRSGPTAGVIGGLLGGAVGAAVSWPMTYLFYHYLDPESGVKFSLLIRGGIWLPIGAAAGLAFGAGLGGARAIVAGLVGGVAGAALGTTIFEVINTLAFPLVRLTSPIPGEWLPRLLADFCVAIPTALGAAVVSGNAGQSPPAPPA